MRTILLILIITLLASAAFGQGAAPSPIYWHFNDSLLQCDRLALQPPVVVDRRSKPHEITDIELG